MKFLKLMAAIGILFFLSSPSFASGQQTFSRQQLDQVLFNHSVLNMSRDSSVFLHSLKLIKHGNSAEVAVFMNYQLDEIVCAAWDFMGRMKPTQKKLTMEFLHNIKQYRAENPRPKNMQVDPTEFSKYFESFDKSYAARADRILERIN